MFLTFPTKHSDFSRSTYFDRKYKFLLKIRWEMNTNSRDSFSVLVPEFLMSLNYTVGVMF